MAAKIHGRLGAVAAAAGGTVIYVVPAGRKATGQLRLCNTSAAAVTLQVFEDPAGGTSPTTASYLYYDVSLAAKATLTDDRIAMKAGASLCVAASTVAVVAAQFRGIEEDA